MAWMNRATKRKLRRFIGWEKVKEAGVYVVHALLRRTDTTPDRIYLAVIELAGALLKAFYYFPVNPWRRSCTDIVRLGADAPSGKAVYDGLVDKLQETARLFFILLRQGSETARLRMGFDAATTGRIENLRQEYHGGFILLPHCVGGVLSATFFARAVPTVIISKGPPSAKRAQVQREFIEMLGVDLLVIDNVAKSTVARRILRVLKAGKFIVATTDLMKKTDDTIESKLFGQTVHLPSWPARFSAKTGRPILSGYVSVRGENLEIRTSDPFIEKDLTAATWRWAAEFERDILADPSDWAFLFDLRWGKLLREAVKARKGVNGQ
jgi:lauroyl/myristoyl acyltransferase